MVIKLLLRLVVTAGAVVSAEAFSWKKSSRTVLLHLGHFGSSWESITYIRQRGQPTRTIEIGFSISSWLGSEETHEFGEAVFDLLGDRTILICSPWEGGGERFSFNSSLGPLLFLRLIDPLLSLSLGVEKEVLVLLRKLLVVLVRPFYKTNIHIKLLRERFSLQLDLMGI